MRWSSTAIGRPCASLKASPRAINIIARVVIKGGKFNLTTGNALIEARAVQPTASPTSERGRDQTDGPLERAWRWRKLAITTPVSSISEPTERSMPAVMITKVCPIGQNRVIGDLPQDVGQVARASRRRRARRR